MLRRIAGGIILVGLATVITAAIRLPSHAVPTLDQLAVHEWGTFTTVAGEDGRAIEWLPLSGPTDLPCFVEHFRNSNTIKILPTEDARLIDYETARSRLWGKVRMETPVLYFYGSARETRACTFTCAFRVASSPNGIPTRHAIPVGRHGDRAPPSTVLE